MSNLKDIFGEVETILVENQEKRESIRDAAKELEAKVIASMQIIKRIHRGGKYEDTLNEAKENMKFIPELYKNVQKLVPEGAFYKFHDIWRLSTVKCCMIMSFVTFLEKGSLITRKECAEILGLDATQSSTNFHLELEDYLIGVLDTCSELARLAPNSVVAGNMEQPDQIHKFLCDMAEGYSQLNLKNDRLRKRYDVLKYDVQKVESVVYDLQVRGVTKRKKPNVEEEQNMNE